MRRLHSRSPFDSLLRLQDALDRAFENPSGGFWRAGPSGRGAFPPLNMFSDADGYKARLATPGVSGESVSIECRGNTITVSGKRDEDAEPRGSVHRRERWSGEFSRPVQFPKDADLSRAEARYSRGILTLAVPRREEMKPRQIKVSAAS